MRINSGFIVLSLACVFLGFILATQFKIAGDVEHQTIIPYMDRPLNISSQIEQAREKNSKLQKQIEKLRKELDEAVTEPQLADLKSQLNEVRAYAGLTEVKGQGVKITLNDSQEILRPGDNPNLYVLHDEDLLRVLNELKAAGTEALSINEHRIISSTEVRCIGPTVLINKNTRLSPPFEIKAVGEPDTIYNSLKMKGGVVDSLKFYGIEVNIEKVTNLVIPPYEGSISFNYAEPVQ